MAEQSIKDFNAAYRSRIREARKAKGWSQPLAAEFMNVPPATYKKWETRSPMPLAYCQKFSELTGVDYNYLTTGKRLRAGERAAND